MRPVLLSTCLMLSVLVMAGGNTRADDAKPVAKAAAKPDASVSEPRTQTLKAFTYFYGSTRTNFQTLGEHIQKLVPALEKALRESHAQPVGSLVFIYKGVSLEPNAEFELQVGFPIAKPVEAAGEFKVREVAEYSCTSVLYTGPMSKISTAYEKLIPAAMSASDQPTDESREMVLYFEGPESPNNIVHLSVGRKEIK